MVGYAQTLRGVPHPICQSPGGNGSCALLILVAKSMAPSQAARDIARVKADARVWCGDSPRSQLVSCTTLIAEAMAT